MSLAAPTATKKVFLAYLDTHYGVQLTNRLIAQDYEVSGLLKDAMAPSANLHPKIKRVLRRSDADATRKALLESDFIVYQVAASAEDAIAAIRLLSTNHYETEKRFVLVSSVMTWFETPPLKDPVPAEEGEEAELEALTEDQFNRRVPHIKYLAVRELEKMCVASASERLKTFVLFAGLPYGLGEEVLHPLFKQAWMLSPEGLPVFGNGKQIIPMIHMLDLVTFTGKILALQEIPDIRYLFATDDGNCSWNDIVGALNKHLGNGKTFRIPTHEFGLYDNVEHFTVNLKIDAQQIQQLMEETDWTCKSGFVENVELVATQYRQERHITPLRVVVLGPPASGKSTAAREIAAAMRIPHFTIGDIVSEYKYQETELKEEIDRMKAARYEKKKQEKIDEKKQALMEEKKAAAEAAITEAANNPDPAALAPNEDNDDVEEEEEVDITLTPDEDKEVNDAAVEENEADEHVTQLREKLEEIKRVLALKQKPVGAEAQEPPNPKDKKAQKPAPKAKKEVVEPKDEPAKELRLSDRALAFMAKWKLTRTQCRNHGFVLDGYPKTIRQARLLLEDVAIEIPEDPEEPDLPLDKEEKPCSDSVFPDVVIHCKAGDTFLLERLQKIQFEHPHNNPVDFQRRLEDYKSNYEVAIGVIQYLESARSTSGKAIAVRSFDMESCMLVPPPPPKSQYAPKAMDPVIGKMIDFIGKPHNFGPSPQDARREAERQKLLLQEQQAEQEAIAKEKREKEAQDVARAQQAKSEEAVRVSAMKEHERQMLEQRKGPLKAYLMSNVIPVLTKGLIEVCNHRPEDPVDFLAEWLFKHNPEDHPEMYA